MGTTLSVVGRSDSREFCSGRGGICTGWATTFVQDEHGNLLGFCGSCAGDDGLGLEVRETFKAVQAKQTKAKKARDRDALQAHMGQLVLS